MIFPDIIREKYLNRLEDFAETVYDQNKSNSLEIVGDAGQGKTQVLHQIKEYLEYRGIFPQVIYTPGQTDFSISQSLVTYANDNGLSTLLSTQDRDALSLKHINDVFTSLRDSRKDILIYCVDDAHLLSQENLDQLNLLFDPEYSTSKRLLILSGRESCGLENQIQLSPFTDEEFDDYISKCLSQSWAKDYPDGVHWLKTVSGNNPYHLYLLLDHTTNNGLISSNYSASIDLLNATKFPDNILEAVESKYQLSDLTDREQLILNLFAINSTPQTAKDLSKLIGRSILLIRKAIKSLVVSGWITKSTQNGYTLFHPLVKEMILKKLSDNELDKLHRICIIECDHKEKAQHALHLKSPNNAEQELLFGYAKELEKEGLYYSAIQVYEKLDAINKTDETQFIIGKNYALLYRNKHAQTYLLPLLKKKQFIYLPEVHYFMGTLEAEQGDLPKATEYFIKASDMIDDKHDLWLILISNVFSNLVESGNKNEVSKILKQMGRNKSNSKKHYLAFLSAELLFHISFPSGSFDFKSHFPKAISCANKLSDFKTLSNLELMKRHWIHEQDNLENISQEIHHAKSGLVYAKKSFDLKQIIKARKILGFALAENGQNGKLIENYRSLIETTQRQNLLSELPSLVANLVRDTYFLGNFKQAEIEYRKAIPIVLNNPNATIKSKLLICEYLMDCGKYADGIKWLKQIKKQADMNGDEFHSYVADGFMYPALYKKDKEHAEKVFNKLVHFMETVEMLVLVDIFTDIKASTLLENNDKTGFRNLIKAKPDLIKESFEMQIQDKILSGHFNAAISLLQVPEKDFDGNSLCYALKLYQWLSKQDIQRPKATQRWTYIYQLIYAITQQSKMESVIYRGNKNKFIKLLESWVDALNKQKPISLNTISNYTKNPVQQEGIIGALKIWNIPVFEEEDYNLGHKDSPNPIIINLLGSPQLYIDQKQLSSKDWANKRSLEILIYIIFRGWGNETPVLLEDILRDFWNPDAEDMDRCRKIRNTLLSRMRKTFKDFEDDMIIQSDGKIQFNWKSENYRLDLDSFQRMVKKGKSALKEKRSDDALRYYESAFYLYRGNLAEGTDGVWIEAIRSHFYQEYVDVVDSLEEIYISRDETNKLNQMMKKVISIYPDSFE